MSVPVRRRRQAEASRAGRAGSAQPPVGRTRAARAAARAVVLAAVPTMIMVLAGCTGVPEPSTTTSTSATTALPGVRSPGSPAGAGRRPPSGGDASQQSTGAPLSGLPTAAELAAAAADVSSLTTRALAGQLVVGRYTGASPQSAADAMRRHGLGGLVTFSDNVPSSPRAVTPALRRVSAAVAEAMAAEGRRWPAFLSVDQEGGPVARVGAPATEFPAAMAWGAADSVPVATGAARASGTELRALGFTVVLAPDADVTIGPADPTIGVRSPGSDPLRVAQTAAAMVQGYLQAGIVPTVKHFPGHGTVTTDSHVGLPRQRASLARLRARDLVPFIQLVRDGAPAVMTGHVVATAVDPRLPASLSGPVTTGLLREELGFQGMVVTDALEMQAVAATHGSGRAAVAALRAGADVVLMPSDPGAAVDALVEAVRRGQLSRERLRESATRMVATLRHVVRPQPPASAVGAHDGQAAALAAASITQLSGRCGGRLVKASVSVLGATATDRSRFLAAARRAGLRIGSGTTVRLLGGGAYAAAGSGSGSGSQTGGGDVVVALDVPYPLAGAAAKVARLATYGRTAATFDALVAILLGRAPATGRLPVPVGSWALGAGCPRRP